ncbi:MAG: cytochrome b5-like heme/steroid binding domain-containing protein [Candidatus Anstonellales archaeon]
MSITFKISLIFLLTILFIFNGCVNDNLKEMPELETKIYPSNSANNVQTNDSKKNDQNSNQQINNLNIQKDQTNQSSINNSKTKTIKIEEIKKHDKPNDCWTIIHGKVYNFSNLASKHPGGDIIYLSCGKDGTELFERKPTNQKPHSEKARNTLTNYYIGDLEK